MNVDEGMRRLRDPGEWDLTLTPRTAVFPARQPRARVVFFGVVATAAVAAVTALVLVTLAPTPQVAGPGPVTSQAPNEPDPTPDPEPVYLAPESCRSLLDPDLVDEREADGWEFSDEETPDSYTEDMRADPDGRAPSLFLEYGAGTVCSFGVPFGDVGIKYAFGPLTGADAAEAKGAWGLRDYKVTTENGWELYLPKADNLEADPMLRAYAFGDGVWAYAFDHSGGDGPIDLIESIIDNAPQQ